MGRYDDEKFITIKPNMVPTLFKGFTNDLGIRGVRSIGDYENYELRINVVPFNNSGDILLWKHPKRRGHVPYTAEFQQRLVTVPHYKDTDTGSISPSELPTILFNNIYLLLKSPDDEFALDCFHYGNTATIDAFVQKGLVGCQGGFPITFKPYADEDFMVGTEHCIDIYALVKVEHASVDSEFIYLPTAMFEQYCQSRHPEMYAASMGFYEDEYDENSTDFRMNANGKKQILTAMRLIQEINR